MAQLKLPSKGTMSSAIMSECSWSDQKTRSGRGRVTAMWTGKTREWPRSTIIFQAPILEISDSLASLLAVCWGSPPATTNWIAWVSTSFLSITSLLRCISNHLQDLVVSPGILRQWSSTTWWYVLGYCAFHIGCTGMNLPPSTPIGWLELGGDHTQISVACLFLRAVALSGLSRKDSLGPPSPR